MPHDTYSGILDPRRKGRLTSTEQADFMDGVILLSYIWWVSHWHVFFRSSQLELDHENKKSTRRERSLAHRTKFHGVSYGRDKQTNPPEDCSGCKILRIDLFEE